MRPSGDRLDKVVVVAFVLALLVPGVAMLGGVRSADLEARPRASLPPIDLATLGDPATYAAIDQHVADHLPIRSGAIAAFAAVDYGLLGGSSNPSVIVGRDGWLFHQGEFVATCSATPAETMAGLDAAAATVRAAHMDMRFIVPPDKHAIYPEKIVPGTGLGSACTDVQRADLQRGLQARPETAIELWDDLAAARATETDRPVYFAQDSHWTPLGALVATRRLIQSIDPSVWDDAEVPVEGYEDHPTDLSRLMGLPATQRIPLLVSRPGVEVLSEPIAVQTRLLNARDIRWYRVEAAARAVEGRTLVIYDSFFGTNQERIVPWFRESVWVHYNDLLYDRRIVKGLPPFDLIVLERSERAAHDLDIEALLGPVVAAARASIAD